MNIEREAAPQTPQIRVDDTGLLEAISATPENLPMDTLRFEYIPPESQSLRVWGRLIVLVEEGEPTDNPDDDDKPGTGGSGSPGKLRQRQRGGSALPPTALVPAPAQTPAPPLTPTAALPPRTASPRAV